MKVLLLFAIMIIAAHSVSTWAGNWVVDDTCSSSCCCPRKGTPVTYRADPNNSSQTLMTATWSDTSVCKRINLSGTATAAMPWAVNNINFNTKPVVDENTFVYWGMITKVMDQTQALVTVNQMNRGGSMRCPYQLIPKPSSEFEFEDSEYF